MSSEVFNFDCPVWVPEMDDGPVRGVKRRNPVTKSIACDDEKLMRDIERVACAVQAKPARVVSGKPVRTEEQMTENERDVIRTLDSLGGMDYMVERVLPAIAGPPHARTVHRYLTDATNKRECELTKEYWRMRKLHGSKFDMFARDGVSVMYGHVCVDVFKLRFYLWAIECGLMERVTGWEAVAGEPSQATQTPAKRRRT